MIKRLVLMTALFSQILLAQQNDLIIQTASVTESNVNWETTLTVNAQSGMDGGMLIEAPSELKLVLLSVRINQSEMLLQNTDESPSNEAVICWDLSVEGVMLFFREGQLNSGDQIVIKTMTTRMKKNSDDNPVINIRSIQKNNQDIQISDTIESSAIMSLEIEN